MTLIIDITDHDRTAEIEDELDQVLYGADQDSATAALLSVVQSIRAQLPLDAQTVFDSQLYAIATAGYAPQLEEFLQ